MADQNVKNNLTGHLVILNGTANPWTFAAGDIVACDDTALADAIATACGTYWFSNGVLQQPVTLTYPGSNAKSTAQDVAMTAYTPSASTGGAIASYSVSPALPSALSMNTSTGSITGTPADPQVATNYTVTATNAAGSCTRVIELTVTA
jgi:hypothetical protein